MTTTRSAKIVFLGAKSSGKTALLNRLIYEDWGKTNPTFNAYLGMKQTHDKKFILSIWDTAGEEKFESLTRYYMRGSHCCIVVIDPTQIQNLDYYSKLCDSIKEEADKNVRILLVSAKSDLKLQWRINAADSISAIHKIFSEKFETMEIPHIEVSSKDNKGIDQINMRVHQLLEQMAEKLPISHIEKQPSSVSIVDDKNTATQASDYLNKILNDKKKISEYFAKQTPSAVPPQEFSVEQLKQAMQIIENFQTPDEGFIINDLESFVLYSLYSAVVQNSYAKRDFRGATYLRMNPNIAPPSSEPNSPLPEDSKNSIANQKNENKRFSSVKRNSFFTSSTAHDSKKIEDNNSISLIQQKLDLLNHVGWAGNEDLRLELQKRIGEEIMQLGKDLCDQVTNQKKASVGNSF